MRLFKLENGIIINLKNVIAASEDLLLKTSEGDYVITQNDYEEILKLCVNVRNENVK